MSVNHHSKKQPIYDKLAAILLASSSFMEEVAKGNANILIGQGDGQWLYRCCVRYKDSLKRNNDYSLQNYQYIKSTVEPLLAGNLCSMELEVVRLEIVEPFLRKHVEQMDDSTVVVFKMPNLKGAGLPNLIYADHFTKVYSSVHSGRVLWEFKPKWLYNTTDYCRNCTHNSMKGREPRYCYALLCQDHIHLEKVLDAVKDVPLECKRDLASYFRDDNNVLAILFEAQKKLSNQTLAEINSVSDVGAELLLAMTLRDVTCFLEWRSDVERLIVNVVDVDMKPKEKVQHWIKTHNELEKHETKHYH